MNKIYLLVIGAPLAGRCNLGRLWHSRAASANQAASAEAAPEIKEQPWDKKGMVADDQANDYVAALTGYHKLMAKKDSLTPEQSEAVNNAALAINQRLYAAANSGDPAAKEAHQAKLAGNAKARH